MGREGVEASLSPPQPFLVRSPEHKRLSRTGKQVRKASHSKRPASFHELRAKIVFNNIKENTIKYKCVNFG